MLFRWLTVFPGCASMVPFERFGWAHLCRGWLVGVRPGKTAQRIDEHKKSPPCVKGGRGGSRRGDRRGWDVGLWHATGGGQGTRETDVGGSEVTDSRACYVDPACLGVAETVRQIVNQVQHFSERKLRRAFSS